MKCRLHKPAAITFAALICTAGVRSQVAGVDARTRSAIEQMHAAYRSLDALHIKVTWTARYSGSMSLSDFPLPGPDVLELRMQRPNKFYMEASAKGDGTPSRYLIVSDGTNHETRPRFTATDFAFTPPPGARKVDAKRKDRKPSL